MAFTQRGAAPEENLDMFNVDYNVGHRGFNIPIDVMLVQAMLNMFYIDFEGDGGPVLGTFELDPEIFGPAGRLPLAVDGIAGTQTRMRMASYRATLMFRSPAGASAYHLDGVFDPYRPDLQRSSITNSLYVFYQLNLSCLRAALRKRDLTLYFGLRDSERKGVPATLRNALKASKAGASQYQMARTH